MSRALVVLGSVLAAGGLAAGIWRVVSLEMNELDATSEPRPLAAEGGAPHMELLRARIEEGEWAMFEVCASDGFSDQWLDRVELVVWLPETQEVIVRAPLDREHLDLVGPRSDEGACLLLGQSVDHGVPVGGEYAIEVVWAGRELTSELLRTNVVGRISARTPLGLGDSWPILVIALGLGLVIAGLTPWTRVASGAPISITSAAVRIALGLAIFVAFMFGLAYVPLGGSFGAVLRGSVIVPFEIALAALLVPPAPTGEHARSRVAALGFVRGRWFLVFALGAPLAGLFLWIAGGLVGSLVPSTGVAPIETLVASPSGVLATAVVALVAAVAEEIFFRGFVYGVVASRFGDAAAFVVSFATFAIAHLPQQWGAWGIFVSVLLVGIGLTALRAASGSVVPSLLAHLAHNGAIVLIGLSRDL